MASRWHNLRVHHRHGHIIVRGGSLRVELLATAGGGEGGVEVVCQRARVVHCIESSPPRRRWIQNRTAVHSCAVIEVVETAGLRLRFKISEHL